MKHAPAALGVALVAAIALLGGCFRATVRSGHPPGAVPDGYDEHWHHGFVGGLVQASGRYPLDQLCPEGWAEVHAKTDPLDGLLTLLTVAIYSPQAVRVVCAEPAPAPSASSAPAPSPPPLPSAEEF